MGRSQGSRSTSYTVIGVVFALLVGGYFVYRISGVVLALLLTILLSIILAAPVNYLARRGIPRTWGVLAVFAAIVGVFWLLGLALIPAVEAQSRQFAEAFPTLLDEAFALADRFKSFFGLGSRFSLNPDSLSNVGREFLTGDTVSTAAGVGLTAANVISAAVGWMFSSTKAFMAPRYGSADGRPVSVQHGDAGQVSPPMSNSYAS